MLRARLYAFLFALAPLCAWGHEFWIEPLAWQVAPGAPMAADIRVGQTMKGAALPFIPNQILRFEVATARGSHAVTRRIGDRPALSEPAPQEGLTILVHATTPLILLWDDWERFRGFVEHKDLGDTLARHAERGLPQERFTESYSRFAKSLIAVGDGQGADRDFGLLTEITALANPYTDDVADGLPVRLSYQGAPRADAQIEVFQRSPDGEVAVSTTRTDDKGVAVIAVTRGNDYMLDAVVMRPVDPMTANGPAWESLWANLTFHVPG